MMPFIWFPVCMTVSCVCMATKPDIEREETNHILDNHFGLFQSVLIGYQKFHLYRSNSILIVDYILDLILNIIMVEMASEC